MEGLLSTGPTPSSLEKYSATVSADSSGVRFASTLFGRENDGDRSYPSVILSLLASQFHLMP